MLNKLSFLFISAILPLTASVEYDIIPLVHEQSVGHSAAEDLSETDFVVGVLYDYPGKWMYKGFIFHPQSGLKVIEGPFATCETYAETVDNKGIVTGRLYATPGAYSECCSRGGTNEVNFTYDAIADTLVMSPKDQDQPIRKNARGDSIGLSGTGYPSWYRTAEGATIDYYELNPFGPGFISATALNDRGDTAGHLEDQQYNEYGFLWNKDKGMQIFGKVKGSTEMRITGMNNRRKVVGFSRNKNSVSYAFFYEESKGIKELGALNYEASVANSINDHTQVVGDLFADDDRKQKAFIWDKKHGMRALQSLIPKDSGWSTLNTAKKINNHGLIIGEGMYRNVRTAFLLIPRVR